MIDENLDGVVGFAYLKDIVRRDFEAPTSSVHQRIDEVMRPATSCPTPSPSTRCSPRCGPTGSTSRSWSRVRRHGGLITIEDILEEIVGEITDEYDEEEVEVEVLPSGTTRVSSRYLIDDLDELFGFDVEEEDVDSVGGLMAKRLGRVPIRARTSRPTACASRPSEPPAPQQDRHGPDQPRGARARAHRGRTRAWTSRPRTGSW